MNKKHLLKLLLTISQSLESDNDDKKAFMKVYDYFDALSESDIKELISEIFNND